MTTPRKRKAKKKMEQKPRENPIDPDSVFPPTTINGMQVVFPMIQIDARGNVSGLVDSTVPNENTSSCDCGSGSCGSEKTPPQQNGMRNFTHEQLATPCQIMLYNDDKNTLDNVVYLLCHVLGHSTEMAYKLAVEAHENGSAIAEVESLGQALPHAQALHGKGLKVSIEKIDS